MKKVIFFHFATILSMTANKQIILLVLMLSVTASAFAVEAEIGGLWYEIITKGKVAQVIQYKNNIKYSGNIVIPETVEYESATYSVTKIGNDAFSSCWELTSASIPGSVTSIGENAFSGCINLISVIISGSVTSIGNGAFWCCSGLTSITIPSGVISIGNGAFGGCSGLTSITIPNTVTNIGSVAFSDCSSLTTITIPGSVTKMGSGAFQNCSGLTSIMFQDGLTSIGENAFANCSSLTSITIPGSVTSIAGNSFGYCISLTSVVIQNGVMTIGGGAFQGCSGLSSVTIPNSITSIGNHAFIRCNSLSSIIIPSSVTSIGPYAFCYCNSLTTVTIGSGVKTIGSQAFANCLELTDVYCYAEKVPGMEEIITRSNSWADIFDGSYIEYATLYVPETSIDAYKATEPWKNFGTIVSLDGIMPETPKCAKPTITFVDGKLEFSCETDGVDYVYDIKSNDSKSGTGNGIPIGGSYTISVYATKEGCANSDVASAEIQLSANGIGIRGDVNNDNGVDVADIATILTIMSTKSRIE
ncbi:MAG: leucine-rich repeat domain-containing protein [Prevotella sp.]|nr:leucine-rich repeat domain-containing protein [Prevotella sp.]